MSHRVPVSRSDVLRSGRVALVTGAAAGLGKGIALRLAERGDRVVFTYRPGGTPPDETLALVRPADPGVARRAGRPRAL